MGSMNAAGFAEAITEGLVSLRQALVWHLTANHMPAVSATFVPTCLAAIAAYDAEDFDLVIEMPNGISKSAGEIVDELHLYAFTGITFEDDGEDYTVGEEVEEF